jgi:hypothetical protein
MNRRKFITSTALVLPSVAVFGAISTQPKTYRSVTSLFSNEEMTEWCNKNGMYYVKDNELDIKYWNVLVNPIQIKEWIMPDFVVDDDNKFALINEWMRDAKSIIRYDEYDVKNKKIYWDDKGNLNEGYLMIKDVYRAILSKSTTDSKVFQSGIVVDYVYFSGKLKEYGT